MAVNTDMLDKVVGILDDEQGDTKARVDGLRKNCLLLCLDNHVREIHVWKDMWNELEPYQKGQFDRLMCAATGIKSPRQLNIREVDSSELY